MTIYSYIEKVENKSFSIGTVKSEIKRPVKSLFSNEDESCIRTYDKSILIKEIRECVVDD